MIHKKKIVHLTSVHPAFDTRIFIKECKTLVQEGYDVALIAPNDKDDIIDGVRIRAVPKPTGRRERIVRTSRDVYRAALEEDANLYHFHDPELIFIGMMLKIRGKTVVYDVHEDLPRQILTKPWIAPFFRRIVAVGAQIMENLCARYFDGVVTATETIADRFPSEKTVILHNYPILGELTVLDSESYSKRAPIAAYIGGITLIRGIKEIVEAVSLIPQRLGVRLVLAGRFCPSELEFELRGSFSWKHVDYLGWQNRKQVAELLDHARVGLVLLHPTLNYLESYPVKLFEYMSAGIPVVASDFPLWREIIGSIGCGVLVDPFNPKSIADAIQWLIEHPTEAEDMGKLGQEAIYKHYNWDKEAEKLLVLYEKLLQG